MNHDEWLEQNPRPAETDEDRAFMEEMNRPVGPERTGEILVISEPLGSGYLIEDQTGYRAAFSDKWIGKDAFNAVAQKGAGAKVRYQLNKGNCCLSLTLI